MALRVPLPGTLASPGAQASLVVETGGIGASGAVCPGGPGHRSSRTAHHGKLRASVGQRGTGGEGRETEPIQVEMLLWVVSSQE